MPESAAIDDALLDLLQGDAALHAVMPDGVYWDVTPPGRFTRFVIVSLVSHADSASFSTRAFEEAVYLVKAVALSTVNNANTDVRTAAARIDELLEQTQLTANGWEAMVTRRVERIRATEVDDLDTTIRWYARGGHYQVVMSPQLS